MKHIGALYLGRTALRCVPSPVKYYKRESQEKYFSHRRNFSCFPAPVNERWCFAPSAPFARFVAQPIAAVWIFSISGFHRVVATKPIRSETDKQNRLSGANHGSI